MLTIVMVKRPCIGDLYYKAESKALDPQVLLQISKLKFVGVPSIKTILQAMSYFIMSTSILH